MSNRIEGTTNHSDSTFVPDMIEVGEDDWETILESENLGQGEESNRLEIVISVGEKEAFIRYEEAEGNTRKGIRIMKDERYVIVESRMPSGEISALGDGGDSEIFVHVLLKK